MRAGSIHAVVVLFPGALGDLLLALPALRALRRRHAGALLTLIVSEPLRALAHVTGIADRVASLDGADAAGLFGGARAPSWLAGAPVVHSWLGARDPAMRARVAAAATQVAWHAVERGEAAEHAAVAYARAVGAPVARTALRARARLVPPRSERADAAWAATTSPVLAVHRGAGAAAKRWRDDGFAAVAQAWQAAGGSVLDVRGPAEMQLAPLAGATPIVDWTLPDLAALLASGVVWLGHDTGPSHLASAAGACGLVLFGPTMPRRWRPLGALDVVAPVAPGTLADVPASRVMRRLRALARRHP
ncbi:MAG: hypothetical protein KIT14_20410 [bacterium]|nr:hypothetical protein [bacterium]